MTQKSDETKASFRRNDRNYSVEFVGGPLDGDQIVTAARPNTEYGVHRFARSEYLYRYRQLDRTRFLAEFDGYLVVESPSKVVNKRWKLVLLLTSAVLALGILSWCLI